MEELALTDPEAFAQWHASRQSGGEGRGLFSGLGRDAWNQAAAQRAGRSGLVNRSTVESPRIERTLLPDTPMDSRDAAVALLSLDPDELLARRAEFLADTAEETE